MAAPGTILSPDRGTAHSVALGVLCALALVQALAVGRAVWLGTWRAEGPAAPPAPPEPIVAAGGRVPVSIPPPQIPSASAPLPMLPPSMPAAGAPAPLPSAAPSLASSATSVLTTRPALPAATAPALDPKLEEMLQVVQQLRPLGDLQSALDLLKKADEQFPDQPVVLHEMAQTFDQMGLTEKALATWRRLEAMGARAGEFRARAAQRLGGVSASSGSPGAVLSALTGLTTPPARTLDPAKPLGLGPCEMVRDPVVTEGERLTLRIPILSHGPVSPEDVNIDVFFFDLVNGEKVEQTRADSPIYTWAGVPVDWQEGQETLDVTYHMPALSREQQKDYGRRKFHGYVVKLYHRNKLMDSIAEPASLLGGGEGAGQQGGAGNPLLPPVGR